MRQWIADVEKAQPAIAARIKSLESTDITVERAHERNVASLDFEIQFAHREGARTTVFVSFMDYQSRADLLITHMTTLPAEFCGRGHGSDAIQKLLVWARDNSFWNVVATQVSDPRSQRFWERNGFVRLPEPNPTGNYGRDSFLV